MGSKARSTVAAIVLTGALTLAGCSAKPGVAAVVDDRTITQSQLHAVQDDFSVLGDTDSAAMLRVMILAPVIIDGAQEAGVGVSTEEARAALEEQAAGVGVTDAEFGDAAVDVRRFEMSVEQIGTLSDAEEIFTELLDRAFALDVEVNPRYGSFDNETLTLTPDTSPWLVTPATAA